MLYLENVSCNRVWPPRRKWNHKRGQRVFPLSTLHYVCGWVTVGQWPFITIMTSKKCKINRWRTLNNRLSYVWGPCIFLNCLCIMGDSDSYFVRFFMVETKAKWNFVQLKTCLRKRLNKSACLQEIWIMFMLSWQVYHDFSIRGYEIYILTQSNKQTH